MLLLIVVLFLAAVPDQSLGQEDEDEDDEDDEEEEADKDKKNLEVSPKHQKEIINKHNEIRRNVKPTAANMLKMKWDNEIAKSAQKWADACNLTVSPPKHRTFKGVMCSENVFYSNIPTEWVKAIQAWESRKKFFKYSTGSVDTSRSTSSYTQLIWYNSYKVGCGVAGCTKNQYFYYYVCQYCPAANRADLLPTPYKKGKSCQDCPKSCEKKLCTNPCKYTDVAFNCKDLQSLYSCKKKLLKESCKATCRCKTEII